jgi:penicillin-binding protein 1A
MLFVFTGFILLIFLALVTLYLAVLFGLFGKLPGSDELVDIRNEEATMVFASDGSLIGKIYSSNRTNIKREDVPDLLIQALVSTEDKRFFSHQGIDRMSYLRVLVKTLLSGDRSSGGGSTLTQQLVKNLYGRKDKGVLTFPVAKIREAILAYRLEKIYSKDEILLLYLNSVPFGENVFGVEAASQRFFSCGTQELKVEQIAMLVGMLKANTFYNPRLYPENAMKRRNQVLQLMHEQNYLSKIVSDSLKNLPLNILYSSDDLNSLTGYFVNQVNLNAEEILKEIEVKTGTHYDLKKDGLKINTTLDIELQKIAIFSVQTQLVRMQKLFDSELRYRHMRKSWEKKMSAKNDPTWKENPPVKGEVFDWEENQAEIKNYRDSLWHYYRMLHASVVMMEPGSGKIRAWLGGNDYSFLPYDLALSKRQIASAFKPVLYAAALEHGISPCAYLENEEKIYNDYNDWHPRNFDNSSGGSIALWYALTHSMNLPTIDLYFKTGWQGLNETCTNLGLPTTEKDYPSVALGSMDITLKEIVTAYCVFANQGNRVTPYMIESISDAGGNVIYKNAGHLQQRAIPYEVAIQITAILEKAINEGTGSTLRTIYNIHSEIAGKTGTAQDYRDAWFISYSPNLVIGTWVGAMDPEVHFQSSNGSGSVLALPIAGSIWSKIESTKSLEKKYTGSFSIPEFYFAQMDCDPVKESNVIEEFFDRLTGKDKPDRAKPKDNSKKDIKEKSKVGKFFDKVFKKKNK